jgi:DNA-binding response OmpR family regulator
MPQVKIIAISGGGHYGLTNMLQAARLMGADRVLAKPFDMQELLMTIRTLLAGAVS